MGEQWSFYLTITIFTTIPHILLLLYTLVLNERHSSSINQLFGWCWFIVVFTECSITCYYGANIHKSFETLSKSVVDLGSRTMIQGDEQYITPNSNKKYNMNPTPKHVIDLESVNDNDYDKDKPKQLRINTKLNAAQQPFFASNSKPIKLNPCTTTPISATNQFSTNINLLLLLVSSMNSIDGISVGGIFTLKYGVIAKFLSALFTFGIL